MLRLRIRFFLFVVLIASLIMAGLAHGKEILILHGHESPNRYTRQFDSQLTVGLEKIGRVHIEYIGTSYHNDDYFDDQFELLAKKWKKAPPFIVVAEGETAASFIRKYGEDLFRTTPVCFCNTPNITPLLAQTYQNGTLFPSQPAIQETIDFLFKLAPQTPLVVCIVDGTPRGLELKKLTEKAMVKHENHAQLLFPGQEPGETGLDLEMLNSVALSVPPSAAVLFLRFTRDKDGNPIDEDNALQIVIAKSEGPTFTVWDHWMGTGVVGGVTVSNKKYTEAILTTIRQIEAGIAPSKMTQTGLTAKPQADLTEVQVRGFLPLLPPETETFNTPHIPTQEKALRQSNAPFYVLLVLALIFRWGSKKPLNRSNHGKAYSDNTAFHSDQ